MEDLDRVMQSLHDTATLGAVATLLLGWMPPTAAVLTVLWLLVRTYNEVMLAVYRRRQHRLLRGED